MAPMIPRQVENARLFRNGAVTSFLRRPKRSIEQRPEEIEYPSDDFAACIHRIQNIDRNARSANHGIVGLGVAYAASDARAEIARIGRGLLLRLPSSILDRLGNALHFIAIVPSAVLIAEIQIELCGEGVGSLHRHATDRTRYHRGRRHGVRCVGRMPCSELERFGRKFLGKLLSTIYAEPNASARGAAVNVHAAGASQKHRGHTARAMIRRARL